MTFNSKVYDTCKYLALVGFPGMATFVAFVGPEWDLPKVDAIVKTLTGLGALLGTLVVVDKLRYNASDAKYDGVIDPSAANHMTPNHVLELNYNAEYDPKKEVLLKVGESDSGFPRNGPSSAG